MTWFYVIAAPFLILLAAITIVDLFRHDYGGWIVAAWVALIIFIPVIGSLAYWLTRQATSADAEQAYLAQADMRRERGSSGF